jgi:AcrR family transcriptional regulator
MTRPSNPEMPERILSAAEKIVGAGGQEALNMRSLARDVGVTPTTLYYYFKSREHILVELSLRAARRLNENVRAVDLSLGPRQAIRALGEAYIGFAEEQPSLYRLLMEVLLDPSVVTGDDRETLRFSYRAARRLLDELVKTGASKYDPDRMAMIGWILLHGFSSLFVAGTLEVVSGVGREELKQVFLDYFSARPFGGAKP